MALTIPVAEIVESSKNPLLGKHDSWGRVLLGDIATIQNGFPFKSSQFTKGEGMPLIRIRDVGADSSDTNYVGDYDPAFIVKAGDLLIGMDGDFNCARWRGPDGLLNQRVCRVILKSDIYHPKLLDYALPGYLKAINDMTSSVTVKHLSSKSIAEIPLPLPPLDQQKRIVAEIEKQFSRLDEAVANLKRVKANLKRYKAAVLKAAVEGRLVETEAERARREGRSYETGAQLLQRILETRRSQWFIPGRGQGKGKYKEPAAPDTSGLPALPEGWAWANFESAADRVTVGHVGSMKDEYVEEGVPFLRSQNVRANRYDPEGLKFVSEEFHRQLAKSSLKPGDIVVVRSGSVGVTCVIPDHLSEANCSDLVIIKTPRAVLPDFGAYYMNSVVETRVAAGKVGIALTHFNTQSVAELPLPIPPMAEQHRIVAEVDRRLSLLRETETQVDANLQRAGRLRQSILQRAFSP